MGQYHGIYNKTKQEYFSFGGAKLWEKAYCVPAHLGLLVLLSNSNGRGGGDLNNPIDDDNLQFKGGKLVKRKAPIYTVWSNSKQKKVRKTKAQFEAIEHALKLVSGRWAGDEIVVQGDYAEATDPAFINKDQLKEYVDITGLVVQAIEACLGVDRDDSDSNEVLETIKAERSYSNGRF